MKLKTTLLLLGITIISVFIYQSNQKTDIEILRAQHAEFLNEHSFNQDVLLSRTERKAKGLPPNAYFEQQYLLEMNPRTGRPEFEAKLSLQKKLQRELILKNVPGTIGNPWVERGPNNVPGRTRAMLFDPNDPTGKRVFAGGVSGGLWRINDITRASSNWTQIGIPENIAVSSITVDKNNSQIWYLGTGESYVQGQVNGNGIWRSLNGGTTWTHIFGGSTGPSVFNGGAEAVINSPGSLAGTFVAVRAGFGPPFNNNVTGNLVLVNNGTGAPTLGCVAPTNASAINGNIAVVERGGCNFTVKVKFAQDAGAVAVIVINNVPGTPSLMGGTDATVTIPSLMISQNDGASILSAIGAQTINATLDDVNTDGPTGFLSVPGIFHINDIETRKVGTTTEIYATVAETIYRSANGNLLGDAYGLYKSVNQGDSWFRVDLPKTTGNNPLLLNDLEVSANNTLWVTTMNSVSFGDGGGEIYSSTDGSNFTKKGSVAGGDRTEITISKTQPNKIYALVETGAVRILKTVDGFATTETINLPDDVDNGIPANDFTRNQAFYDLTIEVDPNNDDIVYAGGVDTFRSIDGGLIWKQISKWSNNNNLNDLNVPLVHADIHEVVFDPNNSDRGLIATDGGIYYANSFAAADGDPAAIFTSNNNFNTTQFYWAAIGQDTGNNLFLGGAQDNGSNLIKNGSGATNNSQEISGGDGGYCFIDKDGQYLITSFTSNNYRRYNLPNPGFGKSIVSDGNTGSFINPADLDDNLDVLYTNGSSGTGFRFSRFTNLSAATPVRDDFDNAILSSTPTVLKVSPYTTTATNLFIGTSGGQLLKISQANGIPFWSNITGSEFVGSISAINFGASENEIMVTFHNYGVESIWYTENGGLNWANKEGDFPDLPVKAIMMNPLLNDEVIIGTDLGVWRTSNFKDANPSWVQSQNGMQNVKVTHFDLRTADNTVLASTYGRGFFTGKFTSSGLSVEENTLNDQIKIFPNPSTGRIKIQSESSFGLTNLSVYSTQGREVYRIKKDLGQNNDLDISHLASGIYILKGNNDLGQFAKKLIIK